MSNNQRHYGIVALIMVFWFVISFITNIIGPLIPDIIDNFKLSHLAMAAFIPTSFFIAYGVMSIPAGIMIEKMNEKTVVMIGFSMPLIGSLLFAFFPSFAVLCASSFIIGLGMAMLQTVINPLKRVAGGEENFTFFSVMGQLVFGLASFVSPFVYSYLVRKLTSGEELHGFTALLQSLTPENLPWASLYWLFAMILVVMLVIVSMVRMPKIELREDERSGGKQSYSELFRNKYVYLFFLGMLAYTATEQAIANWSSEFLRLYHDVDPQTLGAQVVGRFWGLMSVGCLVGLVALRLWNARVVLKVCCTLTLILLLCALFGGTTVSVWSFSLTGFTVSLMFSIIMSTALNSVDKHHGSFAGILCTGIMGGAVGPLVVGWLGDLVGLRYGLLFCVLTIGYIMSIAYWSKPLIENKTVRFRELFGMKAE